MEGRIVGSSSHASHAETVAEKKFKPVFKTCMPMQNLLFKPPYPSSKTQIPMHKGSNSIILFDFIS